jgi:hypothetical protein
MDAFELNTFEDISFDVCFEEGFHSSESVCNSDISETDSEADDCDDEEPWLEIEGPDGIVNGNIEEGVDGLSEISFCTFKHKKNLRAIYIVQDHDTIDTENETDDDEDRDDEPLAVKHYRDLSTTIDCDDLDLSEDVSNCDDSEYVSPPSPVLRECSQSISGFDVYIAFYSIALVIFLALKTLPIDTRGCTTQLYGSRSMKSRESFQPAEALDLQ